MTRPPCTTELLQRRISKSFLPRLVGQHLPHLEMLDYNGHVDAPPFRICQTLLLVIQVPICHASMSLLSIFLSAPCVYLLETTSGIQMTHPALEASPPRSQPQYCPSFVTISPPRWDLRPPGSEVNPNPRLTLTTSSRLLPRVSRSNPSAETCRYRQTVSRAFIHWSAALPSFAYLSGVGMGKARPPASRSDRDNDGILDSFTSPLGRVRRDAVAHRI
jgi:hypothetical protein